VSESSAMIHFFTALAVTVVLTPLFGIFARRIGCVARPKGDRWHRQPTPLLGGVAVYLGAVAAVAPQVGWDTAIVPTLVGATAMVILGVVDDFVHLKPTTKLIAQIVVASVFVYVDQATVFTGSLTVDALLSILWMVGITNAFNLLDNMDGLCAGIGTIAAVSLLSTMSVSASPDFFNVAAALAGSLLGFLFFNFNPASICMGDGGSLFIGFVLSAVALNLPEASGSRSVVTVLALPVLILVIPILDTAVVTVARKLSGRAASQGGTDHLSHRLVALGFSERRAVLLLYALSAVAGGTATLLTAYGFQNTSLLIAPLVIGIVLLGVALAHVGVYEDSDYAALQNKIYTPLLIDLTYKRRVFEVLLDFGLVSLSYYGAYRLKFEGPAFFPAFRLFIQSLPLVIGCKVVAFWMSGVYRGIWKYVGLADLSTYLKAVLLGELLTVLGIVILYDLERVSPSVFVIDALILLVCLVGSRLSFRAFAEFAVRQRKRTGQRVLIYGAGNGGLVLLREILSNDRYDYRPLGFLDDDPRVKGKKVLGYPVLGGIVDLEHLIGRERIDGILLSTSLLLPERHAVLRRFCSERNIQLINLEVELKPLVPRRFAGPTAK
jgi:UDP-GlcNAc:undecaprenyl-phosphate/decaprenyl-phosphate GlcNAc-1-phosphate transferase